MAQSPWFWIALAPLFLETLLIFAKPTWLSALAFFGEQERRITLRSPRREDEPRAGYRDPGRGAATLPALPARTEFSDSVLFADGGQIALRRAFGLGRRQIWLVGITMERSGDEIVLRAKQAFVPITLPLCAIGLGLAMSESGRMQMSFPAALIMPAVMIGVFGLQHVFSRGSRDQGIAEAFDFAEAEVRQALEEPPAPRTHARG